MKIIALAGKKGTGKTYVANKLKDVAENRLGITAGVLSFAFPMRKMMTALLGRRTFEDLYGKKEQPSEFLCGKSMRHAMQTLGTEWGRRLIGESIWVDAAMKAAFESGFDLVLFDDCRFDNEAEAVLAIGGDVLMVSRESCYEKGDGHASEMGVMDKNISSSILNDGTFDEDFVVKMLKEMIND